MKARGTVSVLAMLALGAAGLTPALASNAAAAKKGHWSFTDTTPDPSGNANSSDSMHCEGKLPAGPVDVNTQPVKVKKKVTLSVIGHVVGDWAMEIRDAKGNVLTGTDVNPPASEALTGIVLKKGTYSVVMCNLEGSPTATADFTIAGK